jgi:hypothetical protein
MLEATVCKRILKTTPYLHLKVVKHFGPGCSGRINFNGEIRAWNVTNGFVQNEYVFLNEWIIRDRRQSVGKSR